MNSERFNRPFSHLQPHHLELINGHWCVCTEDGSPMQWVPSESAFEQQPGQWWVSSVQHRGFEVGGTFIEAWLDRRQNEGRRRTDDRLELFDRTDSSPDECRRVRSDLEELAKDWNSATAVDDPGSE